ncbi:MAG: hypothetical protein EZS28_013445 [Streblomastix strix]|uniref:Uncharacterized protein n=1 Tax=Streblomastix strix TaxID=222440 RepID=A0A5J4W8Q2_9EUKA|nr:MAG: hypothetical protein EZS28_013445 [Streblomastix strix]
MITTDVSISRQGVNLQIIGNDIQRISKPWKLILQHNHLRYVKERTDNTKACFNQTKGKAKIGLRQLIDQILLYIEEQQWEVKFRHIPGVKNIEADSLLRFAVSGDYSIDKQVLQQVLEEWEIQITIDCFAIRRNAKHYRYFSIESDALAENWDRMEQSWECEIPLLHYLISLIVAVIYKVELEQVKAIRVAPVWRGQEWRTSFMRITICQKEPGDSQNVLIEGAWMKMNKQKRPPGKIGIFLVDGERRESNYLRSAFQTQNQQDNQYKEQQMEGTEYWAQQSGTVLQLSTLEHPYLTIDNYITYIKPLESDVCIIQSRRSISTLFELIGKLMNSIRNRVIQYLMKEHVDRAAKLVGNAERRKQAKLGLFNEKVQRADLRIENVNQREIVIVTMTMKKPRGPVEKTLKAARDRTVCPIRWIQNWLDKREVKGELKKEQVWRNRRKEKVWSADKSSKGVKQVCLLFELCPNKQGSSHQRRIVAQYDRRESYAPHPVDIASLPVSHYELTILFLPNKQLCCREAADPDAIVTPLGPLNASNDNNNNDNQCNDNDDNNNSNSDNKQRNNNDDTNNNNINQKNQKRSLIGNDIDWESVCAPLAAIQPTKAYPQHIKIDQQSSQKETKTRLAESCKLISIAEQQKL